MKLSQLIEELEKLKEQHGDLNVCTSHEHEYWGNVDSHLTYVSVRNAQPEGPKSGKIEMCVVIGD